MPSTREDEHGAPPLPTGLWVGMAVGLLAMAALLIFGRSKAATEEMEPAARADVTHVTEDAGQGASLPSEAVGPRSAPPIDEPDDEATGGVGQLLARRPGRSEDAERVVRLSRHVVRARIAGNVARTEVDETFTNDTGDELEGIYRFPLPHGARIERLALEVDGELVEGSFVERAKAAAIWRGALRASAPKAPKPREEIIWVPGPWHDPALLEWTHGGRFELRVFPIPKHGSRRIVVAYTETVAPSAGVRRYVYPLPRGAGAPTIDDFSFEAQVVGHDATSGVRAAGYVVERRVEPEAERLSMRARSFVPAGDLTITYALSDRDRDWTSWGYRAPSGDGGPADVGGDAFVAIALRPAWPRPAAPPPRDLVVVVAAGRSMFGERFERARRLAVAISRRASPEDRVTVLACDVVCRALGKGFVTPGEATARDVDAFLAAEHPEGASDLVSAVREAIAAPGRERARALRVVLVGDGVASAGYRSRERVAAAVRDAMTDPTAEIVAVPVGADADAPTMEAIARAGGGVVVPHGPGRGSNDVALEVLDAASGSMLRDVSLALPEGLYDVAPSALGAVRPGEEIIVTARTQRSAITGDVRLRGTVAGAPFDAAYPLRVTTTTERANAFVPRLHAALRIADAERDGSDGSRDVAVALSKRYAVPSRWTSLLVLESEAMFSAFGIDRTTSVPSWTGDEVAEASLADAPTSAGTSDLAAPASGLRPEPAQRRRAFDEAAEPKKAASASPSLGRAAPAPSIAPPFVPPLPSARREGGRYMKKTYVRRATIAAASATRAERDKLDAAREAVLGAPDARAKRKELARLLARGGRLDELEDVLTAWEKRDPFDVDALLFRADAVGRRGDRQASLRVATGVLSSAALTDEDAFTFATTLARSYERIGEASLACALRITAAELKGADADARARAVVCERRAGRSAAGDRWLDGLDAARRRAVERAIARVDDPAAAPSSAPIVVSARWEDEAGGVDLDVSIVDPSGRRAAAVTRVKGARASGATSTGRETVGLSTGEAGPFLVEITRVGTSGPARVRGEVEIRAFGKTKKLPFVVAYEPEPIARIDVRWDVELVPVDGPEPRPPLRPMRRDPVIFGP